MEIEIFGFIEIIVYESIFVVAGCYLQNNTRRVRKSKEKRWGIGKQDMEK
jgi:hypothetical protein